LGERPLNWTTGVLVWSPLIIATVEPLLRCETSVPPEGATFGCHET